MAIDQLLVDQALKGLTSVRDTTPEGGWERTVVDAGLSLLTREGLNAVRALEQALVEAGSGKISLEKLTDTINRQLTLREASDFLVALENGEAARVKRSRELLQMVQAVARTVAEELLKLALGGK